MPEGNLVSGYQVYDPVFGIATAMLPTVSKSEAWPCRRVNVTVLEESGVQVIVNLWPATRVVPDVIEVMTF